MRKFFIHLKQYHKHSSTPPSHENNMLFQNIATYLTSFSVVASQLGAPHSESEVSVYAGQIT